MKRIIMHWSAGAYKASSLDKKHYHKIVEGDGKIVNGDIPIENNSAAYRKQNPKGAYAAHTLNCNTDSIGISMACMAGAVEGKTNGKNPMTQAQFESMCKLAAELCKKYKIPVTNKTVLSHAEVQTNLGIKQRGKWDFTVIPFKPELKGAAACGNYARDLIKSYMAGPKATFVPADEVAQKSLTVGDQGVYVKDLNENLSKLGYDVPVTDTFTPETEKAVKAVQEESNLVVDAEAGPRTQVALGEKLKEQELAPKIKEAAKKVPTTAVKEVKEKTNLWSKILGFVGAGGVSGLGLWGMDWTAILAIGGVVVGLIVVLLLLQNQIVAAFEKINKE